MTIAERFAEKLCDDGQNWVTANGETFGELARRMGADITYSARGDDGYIDGHRAGYLSGDPIRYEFSDGSAVVIAGDAWDIEGPHRYSWAGA